MVYTEIMRRRDDLHLVSQWSIWKYVDESRGRRVKEVDLKRKGTPIEDKLKGKARLKVRQP